MPVPSYAIDDQTAIKVTDGSVEVVSEGHWKLLAANPRHCGFARDQAGQRITASWLPPLCAIHRAETVLTCDTSASLDV
jgi:hypothetical protein